MDFRRPLAGKYCYIYMYIYIFFHNQVLTIHTIVVHVLYCTYEPVHGRGCLIISINRYTVDDISFHSLTIKSYIDFCYHTQNSGRVKLCLQQGISEVDTLLSAVC
jgi:hypothetical protein